MEKMERSGYAVQKLPEGGWQVNALLGSSEDARPDVYLAGESDWRDAALSDPAPLPWVSGMCRVPAFPRGQRGYLHLRFPDGHVETEADRILPLERGFNFRDLGGYRTPRGQMVRWGKLYRSARLSRLTQQDQTDIRQLELRTIFDLRSGAESERDPTPGDLAADIRRLPLNLTMDLNTPAPAAGSADTALALSMLRDSYRAFTQSRTAYAEFFHLLLAPESGPVLFHCTAGKDRTGVTAALLLWALDVPWDIIVQDFVISNQFTSHLMQLIAPGGTAVDASHPLWPMAWAYPENLEAAIETIVAEYGSLDRFFVKGLELGPGWKESLQNKYLSS